MRKVDILDCTLRDGGRIIDCKFGDEVIRGISKDLDRAGVDIIEVGFLRDAKQVTYTGNSTFFTSASQITPFLPRNRQAMFVAFIDFDMFDFATLEECNDSIAGLRVGFTKKQFFSRKEELRECLLKVKRLGYKLFVQGVNSLGYTDREMLDVVGFVNDVEPYSFGIVDTYGGMYLDDMTHYFNLVDYNLKHGICIDIHCHNNFQLSFAIAQQIISMCSDTRHLILDATLDGMGKCAGNLNTELLADYLVRRKGAKYDFDAILDTIDQYIYPYKQVNFWGYSIPSFMAGIYQAHPNNVIYLTQKFRLKTKDIKNIISMIDPEKRQRYDYDNIERIYIEYGRDMADDEESLKKISEEMHGKAVLVLVPGHTLTEYKEEISRYIQEKNIVVISVNYVPDDERAYIFWGNKRRYDALPDKQKQYPRNIICSNVRKQDGSQCVVNYFGLINQGYRYFDNSTMMLLNLLAKIGISKIVLAGFDGFAQKTGNFMDDSFSDERLMGEYDVVNAELEQMMMAFIASNRGKIDVSFLTPSRFEKYLG